MHYDSNNVFAKILKEEIPCNKVYEDNYAIAFYDIEPLAPLHILVIPKHESRSFSDFIKKADAKLITGFFQSVQQVIAKYNLEDSGYRIISNCGKDGMQTVDHFHIHILGQKELGNIL